MNIGEAGRNSVFGLVIAGLAGNVPAFADNAAGNRTFDSNERQSGAGLVYTNRGLSQAIYGYLNLRGVVRNVENPQIAYVDMAYGPSIYSYPRLSRDTVVGFNVHYVSRAYGPAIYSYPRLHDSRGWVEVFPFMKD